ncbi:MAG: MATE family efflux transporter [Cyclobacteriaceae bacterium]|nr:MATE family efflux transporter [Cyclobacteriaceae bacterium]
MTIKQHLKKNITLAFPVMVGQLGHIMVVVADTAMVGRVGVIPLAGATYAGTFYHLLMLFGIGVSYAITPLVAATNPTDRNRLIGFLENAFVLNLMLGILLFLLGLAIWPFLGYFGQEADVVAAAKPYLLIVSASLVPLMVFQTFRQYTEGLSDTFNPMVISIVTNLLNVGLNYLLIFGHFGFPALGLNGAGYATLIARVVMAVLMMAVIYPKWKGMVLRFDTGQLTKMLRLGLPSGLQYIFEVGAFAMAAIMVGWIGAEALAAHQIALNLAAISYMAATGIAAASTIRIGNQIGLKDLVNLKMAGYSCMGLVTVFMGFCGLVFIVFRHALVALYIDDPGVQALAASLLIIAAGFQVSDGLQTVGLGVLRGLTDVKVPTIVTFVSFWLIAIPGSYLLGFVFDLGIKGVWYALSAGLSIAAVMHILRFRAKTKDLRF